jgi:DNA-binding MarR family transcriptional regulator
VQLYFSWPGGVLEDEFIERIASRVASLLRTKQPEPARAPMALARLEPVLTKTNRCSQSPVRAMLASRRRRADYFDASLFADPAWDILLDLYAADQEGVSVSVSSLCIAASVPATTALRWIVRLEAVGLICREPDPFDGRRDFLQLKSHARDKMEALLQSENLI